jgi:hypothetical protein
MAKEATMSKSSTTPSIAAIRRALRAEFGARKYRITREGEVHVYGPMTNAEHIIGWALFGHLREKQLLLDLDLIRYGE